MIHRTYSLHTYKTTCGHSLTTQGQKHSPAQPGGADDENMSAQKTRSSLPPYFSFILWNCSPLSSSVLFSCSVVSDSLWPHDCSMPSFPVHHQLPELAQAHGHCVGDAIQPSYPLSSPSPPAFNLSNFRVFCNESVLHIRWSKYWSFSFSSSE